MDVLEAEKLFAQKLVSADQSVRNKAVKRLRKWLSSRIQFDKSFSHDDFIRIWKGLYYCLWMQDKPLLHEELCNNIASFSSCFYSNEEQSLLWHESFLDTVCREWSAIDFHRVDKFMMLMRVELREHLRWLAHEDWDDQLLNKTFNIWQKSVQRARASSVDVPDGLKMHFLSMFLDELDFVGAETLSSDQTVEFITPFANMLVSREISDNLFASICSNIFEAVLLTINCQVENDAAGDNKSLTHDFSKLADLLFQVGKCISLSAKRRATIYELVKKYRSAALGFDPLEEILSSGSEYDITENDVEIAAKRMSRNMLQYAQHNRQSKKKLRKLEKNDQNPDIDAEDETGLSDFAAPPKRKKRRLAADKVPKKQKKKKRKIITDESDKLIKKSSKKSRSAKRDRYFTGENESNPNPSESGLKPALTLGNRKMKFKSGKFGDFLSLNGKTADSTPENKKLKAFMKTPPSFAKKAVAKVRRSRS